MVMWTSDGGQDGDGTGAFARRFDASGVAAGGEFRINETTTGDQRGDGETD